MDNKSIFDFDPPKEDDPFKSGEDSEFSFDQLLKTDDPFTLNVDSEFSFDQPQKTDDSFTSNDDSEFSFEQPQSNAPMDLDVETIDLPEPVRTMDCVCPKCAERTEVDLSLLPENGFVTVCSSCNKQIHIKRESCACRAKRKSYEINCAICGKQLDRHAHCHSCGTNFPDYFVTFNPDDARRKSRKEFFYNKWAAIRDLRFSLKPAFKNNKQDFAPSYSPTSRTFTTTTASSSIYSRKRAVFSISIIVTLAFIAAGIFAYNSYKSGQIYAENYFKALYCIKTGVDSNLSSYKKFRTEWEPASAAGQSSSPGISNRDETKSIKLRSEVDKYMQKLSKPPKRFLQANNNLTKIHNIYLDSETLIQSKPRSLQELNNTVNNLNKRMGIASQELKFNLPDSFKPELENTKLKYRGMKDF